MKTGYDWQFLHRQLFSGLLVAETSRTLDLCRRSQVLGSSESLQTVLQRSRNRSRTIASCHDLGARWRAKVKGNIPKGIYCRGHTAVMSRTKKRKWLGSEITVRHQTESNSYYWQAWQTTSDCKPPVKIWSMIHVHRLTEFSWGWVDCCSFGPLFKIIFHFRMLWILRLSTDEWFHLQCRWSTSKVAMKNSWASCCSYPAKWRAWVQIKWSSRCNVRGALFPE